MSDCPFCSPDQERVFNDADPAILCLWDAFPVSRGHALVITRRHVATWFEATRGEQASLLEGIEVARREIEARYRPDGFNIGLNVGEAAGQTVSHLHVHVIPRYAGDVPDPRGGVRHVIPSKGNYLLDGNQADEVRDVAGPGYRAGPSVVGSDANPLLHHLLADLTHAESAHLAVAFVQESGLRRIQPYLKDILDRGGRVRFLTGDYLGITAPHALMRLLDLEGQVDGAIERRVFETTESVGFHPKAYLIKGRGEAGTAFVGSSNLSRAALEQGVEWNYRIESGRDPMGFAAVEREFEELFWHPRTRELTAEWVAQYRARRRHLRPLETSDAAVEPPEPPPEPHSVQQEALAALRRTREEGNRAGLVVLATGLGKTWLSAFDSVGFPRILFVAHREEILAQARETYRRIRPDAALGHYTGKEKALDADVVFASVQTLGKARHLERFPDDTFDYIVVDEFHHAAAKTYRRILDHFEPRFLLGLTATPERTDGGDLLALCGENLVYRCDLPEAIERDLLVPFHYFGVPDDVDYANIPWRSGRFDPEALEAAVATQRRAENAFEQWQEKGGKRTLGFCVSQRHADFMSRFFTERGVRAAAVHAGPESAPRAASLEALERGELEIVFSVDMFNEGVDLPDVDTVMMLRPTESRVLWLQQLGRGLRKAEDKPFVTVVDYIGNHRTFLQGPMSLLPSAGETPGEIAMALERLLRGELTLPRGCEVTYALEAVEILRSLARMPKGADTVRAWYEDFRHRNGVRPSATEAWHSGHDPRAMRKSFGSWLGFVKQMGDLDEASEEAFALARPFLEALETTPMTKSYKMVLLEAMMAKGRFPGAMRIDELVPAFAARARRSAWLVQDVGPALQQADDGDDEGELRRLLERNPIDAWIEGKGTGGVSWFTYDGSVFAFNLEVPAHLHEAMRELTRELCDWRLAQYVDRLEGESGPARRIVCNVSHAEDRPILFLPDRAKNPGIPTGWTPFVADGRRYEANFVKIAINVARREGSEDNDLPDLLRGWFGPEAGQPGRGEKVLFERQAGLYRARPLGGEAQAVRWQEYARADIAPLFGLPYKDTQWRQTGIVHIGNHYFLLVTLEKAGMAESHQYRDRFLSADLFQWQSQNQNPQKGKVGQDLKNHRERGIDVHLFVRRYGKTQKGTAAPFTYCGELDFVEWEGEKPITIRWRLREAVPERLLGAFALVGGP